MITILTVPKSFKGFTDTAQRNAIKSWIENIPGCEIILFGNDYGIDQAAKELGILHVHDIKSEFGLPFLSSVFDLGRKIAKNNFLAFINTDIILTNNFLNSLNLIKFPNFLITGRRWDLDVKEPINFNNFNWSQEIIGRAKDKGKLHGFAGMDYFIFPKNLDLKLPDFVAGRPGYDSWMVYQAHYLKIPVIDATETIKIIHQNHDYSHRKGGEKVLKEKEGDWNIKLAGGFSKMLTLREADWILTLKGLKRPEFKRIVMGKLASFYPWRLLLSFKRKLEVNI
jgi:hypothetical protein